MKKTVFWGWAKNGRPIITREWEEQDRRRQERLGETVSWVIVLLVISVLAGLSVPVVRHTWERTREVAHEAGHRFAVKEGLPGPKSG